MQLSLGVGLVASMLDPINIGSAFVPVVNTARFASLAARYGKNSARALTGAVEGAVGATLVEPLILTAAAVEQDKDYNLYDSFMNVVFGTALGGGLHVIGGKTVGCCFRNKAGHARNTYKNSRGAISIW